MVGFRTWQPLPKWPAGLSWSKHPWAGLWDRGVSPHFWDTRDSPFLFSNPVCCITEVDSIPHSPALGLSKNGFSGNKKPRCVKLTASGFQWSPRRDFVRGRWPWREKASLLFVGWFYSRAVENGIHFEGLPKTNLHISGEIPKSIAEVVG